MRALRLLICAIITAALCTIAAAQDHGDVPTTSPPAPPAATSPSAPPAATTGAAPRAPGQAPVGHRQPKTTDAPSQPTVSPYDQKIDRDLNICRNC